MPEGNWRDLEKNGACRSYFYIYIYIYIYYIYIILYIYILYTYCVLFSKHFNYILTYTYARPVTSMKSRHRPWVWVKFMEPRGFELRPMATIQKKAIGTGLWNSMWWLFWLKIRFTQDVSELIDTVLSEAQYCHFLHFLGQPTGHLYVLRGYIGSVLFCHRNSIPRNRDGRSCPSHLAMLGCSWIFLKLRRVTRSPARPSKNGGAEPAKPGGPHHLMVDLAI